MLKLRILKLVAAVVTLATLTRTATAHYEPTLGRWLERDPSGYVDGANLYDYGRGVATTVTDPRGLECCGGTERPKQSGRPFDEHDGGGWFQEKWRCCGNQHDGAWYLPGRQCCENGSVSSGESIWVCTRPLHATGWFQPDIGPLHHAFIACKQPKHDQLPYDEDGWYAFGKQPRKLFDLEKHGPETGRQWNPGEPEIPLPDGNTVKTYLPPDHLFQWAFSDQGTNGYIDWETNKIDARRCKEVKVCASVKSRMCQRGPSDFKYDFMFDNCQHWAAGVEGWTCNR
jgi:hypothetical protein